jgi:hypothetical protein
MLGEGDHISGLTGKDGIPHKVAMTGTRQHTFLSIEGAPV